MTNQEFLQKTTSLNNLLFSYALRLTRSRQDAEDLVQETTMKAYHHREKFASLISTVSNAPADTSTSRLRT